MRTLASIYPLINVITSTNILRPLFNTLDIYGWYPVTFTHTVLKALSGSKTKEAYSKPAYLHVIMHVVDLLPILREGGVDDDGYDDDDGGDGGMRYAANGEESQGEGREDMERVVEMVEKTVNPQFLIVVNNVLAVRIVMMDPSSDNLCDSLLQNNQHKHIFHSW